MLRPLFDKLAEHPRRRLIVTTGTFVIGLTTVLPGVDDYLASREKQSALEGELASVRQELAGLSGLRQRATEKQSSLAELRQCGFSESTTTAFRDELEQLVRSTNCRLRRAGVSAPRTRRWLTQDDPQRLTATPTEKNPATPYQLTTHTMNVTVAGSLGNVKRFLHELQHQDKLLVTPSASLRAMGSQGKEVNLEMELLLFDLRPIESPGSPAT